jgi:hypothetical protein
MARSTTELVSTIAVQMSLRGNASMCVCIIDQRSSTSRPSSYIWNHLAGHGLAQVETSDADIKRLSVRCPPRTSRRACNYITKCNETRGRLDAFPDAKLLHEFARCFAASSAAPRLQQNSVASVRVRSIPSDRHLSAKFVPALTDRWCRVVCATDPHVRILGFLDRTSTVNYRIFLRNCRLHLPIRKGREGRLQSAGLRFRGMHAAEPDHTTPFLSVMLRFAKSFEWSPSFWLSPPKPCLRARCMTCPFDYMLRSEDGRKLLIMHMGTNTLLSTPFSNTLSLWSSKPRARTEQKLLYFDSFLLLISEKMKVSEASELC